MRKTATLTALQAEALGDLTEAAAGVISVAVAIVVAGPKATWRQSEQTNSVELRRRLRTLIRAICEVDQQMNPSETE